MAFTRANGKHRRPGRVARAGTNVGVAALATTGVVTTLAGPAAAHGAPAPAGLRQASVMGDSLAHVVDAQAEAQKVAAEAAAAQARTRAEARRSAEEARRIAAEKAERKREAEERAARARERKRLNTFVLPVKGSSVSTGYQASGGAWSSGSHTGIDFHADPGTSVHAVGAGTVVEAGWGGAYGNNIVIKMRDGSYTHYAHLSSIAVSVGESVTPGKQIGLSGSTGNTSGPHLHFEARSTAEYGSDIDPVAYLRAHGLSL
ncbi:M23 family metallopeptidase [Streptomyces meridianus]|uniref:M23 family metallopeptidase n=1 Tax=Streptomyces meridianus TaxID=2938945 RepID=A0ABT0X8J5_9ACTN|nr:M23 family metallopeptidase [Streptomyces meridianus]MCM2578842.1 M23 family metallopeptidase [Streptomyces meridianus]